MKGNALHKRIAILSAVFAALAAAAGGYAYATTTSSNTAVAACAKTVGGQLRLDTGDGCLPSEQAVHLGGPSHVDEWAQWYGIGGGVPMISGTAAETRGRRTVFQTFHLDKGQYLVSSEILAVNNDGGGIVVCTTGNAALGISLAQAAVGNGAGFAKQQTMQEQTVFDVPSDQDLKLECFNVPEYNTPVGNPEINYFDITATKIDSSTFNDVANP